ncbi:MAG: 3-deoxy-D-manno-octulosonic acid kinase [Granulosicoccus sp.]|nr:3-deoxy-D-manno-octulosonic acid kinase [Granulosicoccus sp.]
MAVITEHPATGAGTSWRYCQEAGRKFDPRVFDEEQLMAAGLVTGAASAGRGNTFFFTSQGQALVLRHYHRGGLVRHLSRDRYVYTGLERTRACREFAVLSKLCEQGFPAPRPYACRVVRRGLLYTASLVTHRLDGRTLAERLTEKTSAPPGLAAWRAMGDTIAGLHALGCEHADLNAHNIMLDEHGSVSIIDFDRARFRSLPSGNADSGWCLANIRRLERSLAKLSQPQVYAEGFAALQQQWRNGLGAHHSP